MKKMQGPAYSLSLVFQLRKIVPSLTYSKEGLTQLCDEKIHEGQGNKWLVHYGQMCN